MSIVREGNTDLEEYRGLAEQSDFFAIQDVNGRIYNLFPIGTTIVAVPFVFILDKIDPDLFSSLLFDSGVAWKIEVVIASLVVALTTVFTYLIGQLLTDKKRYALLMAFIFAFCTSAWSTAARALWQHGPSMLMLTLSLYIILLARNRPKLIQYASLPLAFSYVIRPTNSISIILFTIYVLLQHRKYFFRFVLWAMVAAVPFVIYNLIIYDSILPWYYRASRLGNPNFFEALLGNLASPARGLFVFSPILLFSIFGFAVKAREKNLIKLDYFVLAIIIMHWITISLNADWWGGWAFGPRMFSDMIPYFIYFLAPSIVKISAWRNKQKVAAYAVFISLALFSLFVNFRGASDKETWLWNKDPNAPARVSDGYPRMWDWSDLQFLRGI